MFRIIYNGQILTSYIKGCNKDEELCDLDILLNIIQKFTMNAPHCDDDVAPITTPQRKEERKNDYFSHLVLTSFISFLVGCCFVFCFILRRYYHLLDVSSSNSYMDSEKYCYTSLS